MRDIEFDTIPRSRAACPDCEATPAGCRGLRSVAGRYCCKPCDLRNGDHDRPEETSHAA